MRRNFNFPRISFKTKSRMTQTKLWPNA